MTSKEQAENALDILYCAISYPDNTDLKSEDILAQYILQMEAIAARYNYLRSLPESCEANHIDVVFWEKSDESCNDGRALRGDELDKALDKQLKEAK